MPRRILFHHLSATWAIISSQSICRDSTCGLHSAGFGYEVSVGNNLFSFFLKVAKIYLYFEKGSQKKKRFFKMLYIKAKS